MKSLNAYKFFVDGLMKSHEYVLQDTKLDEEVCSNNSRSIDSALQLSLQKR